MFRIAPNIVQDFHGCLWYDLGDGQRFFCKIVSGSNDPQLRDQWCGIDFSHPDKRDPSKRCMGYLGFKGFRDDGHAVWTKTGDENTLTLSPSIHCDLTKGGCGEHGFIENSRWRNA